MTARARVRATKSISLTVWVGCVWALGVSTKPGQPPRSELDRLASPDRVRAGCDDHARTMTPLGAPGREQGPGQ